SGAGYFVSLSLSLSLYELSSLTLSPPRMVSLPSRGLSLSLSLALVPEERLGVLKRVVRCKVLSRLRQLGGHLFIELREGALVLLQLGAGGHFVDLALHHGDLESAED